MNPLRHFFHDLALLPRDLRLLSASIFAWGVGESLFFYVIALYLKQLGATPVQIGNIYDLGAATTVVTAIPARILADRWGRKQVMWLGWLAGLAAVALMASTTNSRWFAVGCTQFNRPCPFNSVSRCCPPLC